MQRQYTHLGASDHLSKLSSEGSFFLNGVPVHRVTGPCSIYLGGEGLGGTIRYQQVRHEASHLPRDLVQSAPFDLQRQGREKRPPGIFSGDCLVEAEGSRRVRVFEKRIVVVLRLILTCELSW